MAATRSQGKKNSTVLMYAAGPGRRIRRLPARLGLIGLVAIGLYIASFLVVFDLGRAAPDWDEEYSPQGEVALGPRPRAVFARPSHWNVAYEASQWPFQLYRPLCAIWLRLSGYSLPAEWR